MCMAICQICWRYCCVWWSAKYADVIIVSGEFLNMLTLLRLVIFQICWCCWCVWRSARYADVIVVSGDLPDMLTLLLYVAICQICWCYRVSCDLPKMLMPLCLAFCQKCWLFGCVWISARDTDAIALSWCGPDTLMVFLCLQVARFTSSLARATSSTLSCQGNQTWDSKTL